tara:strand:+ start:478 stop:672 length:195 start_codon:yes stop_codon:yes gene_type:complete
MSHEVNDKIQEQLNEKVYSMTTTELINYCDNNNIRIGQTIDDFHNYLSEIVINHKWENYPEGGK